VPDLDSIVRTDACSAFVRHFRVIDRAETSGGSDNAFHVLSSALDAPGDFAVGRRRQMALN